LNRKKIIILVSVLVLVICIPILFSQAHRIFKRNSLDLGYYTIESVYCTDKFGDSITLMVKPSLSIRYELFPEVIDPLENITYYDNTTNPNSDESVSKIPALGGAIQNYFVYNNLLYIAHGFSGLIIYDVTKYTNPIHLSTITIGDSLEDVYVEDNYVYVPCYQYNRQQSFVRYTPRLRYW